MYYQHGAAEESTQYVRHKQHYHSLDLFTTRAPRSKWKKNLQFTEEQTAPYEFKVLFDSFRFNGHTQDFLPESENLEPTCTSQQTDHLKVR